MTTLELERLGQGIRAMRKRRGLTQATVATMAGVPRLKIIQVERGSPGVAVETYARVARAVGGELSVVAARLPTLEEAREFFRGDQ